MTVRVPAFLQGASHPAEDTRLALMSEFSATGITGSNDLQVTANGTPNMSVNVASGAAVIAGSQSSTQGYYRVYSDATTNVAIAAADPTNPRIDLIVLQVQDAFYSGSSNNAQIVRVAGTPAASPVAPSAPANSYILAQIAVAANATSITSGNITDKRTDFAYRKPVRFQADQAYTTVLTAKGTSGQTADLIEGLFPDGTVMFAVKSEGTITNLPGGATDGARLFISGPNTTASVATFRMNASGTGNIITTQDSSGNANAAIDRFGSITSLLRGNSAATSALNVDLRNANTNSYGLYITLNASQAQNAVAVGNSGGTTLALISSTGLWGSGSPGSVSSGFFNGVVGGIGSGASDNMLADFWAPASAVAGTRTAFLQVRHGVFDSTAVTRRTGIRFANTSDLSGEQNKMVFFGARADDGFSNTVYGEMNVANSSAYTFNASGTATATSWTSTSDSRAKHAIKALREGHGLDIIRKAPAKSWRYAHKNVDPDRDHVGPIADDLPDFMLHTVPGVLDEGDHHPHAGMKAVDLRDMIGVLWHAVSELDVKLASITK